MASGSQFEDSLVMLIKNYSRHIYRNVKIETLLTSNGLTEIDIMFCYANMVIIVESKNVSEVHGDYNSISWRMVGSKVEKEYKHLNVIVQNNIHVRSFKDAFYELFGEWPVVAPFIVVPDTCIIDDDIRECIYTVSNFTNILELAKSLNIKNTIHRKVSGLFVPGEQIIKRKNFVYSPSDKKRVKGVV